MPRSKFTEEANDAQHEALALLREKMQAVAAQEGGKGAQILLDYARLCHEIFVSSAISDVQLDRLNAGEVREGEGAHRANAGGASPANDVKLH